MLRFMNILFEKKYENVYLICLIKIKILIIVIRNVNLYNKSNVYLN